MFALAGSGSVETRIRKRDPALDIFDIPYYNELKRFLQFLGQDPRQSESVRFAIVVVMVVSAAGIFIPTSLEVCMSMKKKDMDAVIECLPHLIATVTSVVKILNLYFYRENFKRMFGMTVAAWHRLGSEGELAVLETITARGGRVARLYRNTLLIFTVLFVSVPMLFPIMDVIAPLNETRPRQQMLRVNYVAFDADEYFFYVYLQLSWSAVVVVSIIVTVDSLYIVIIHHNSGLFAVCGCKLQKVTKRQSARVDESSMYEQFRECILAHEEAIEFYDALNQSSRNSYLLQVGLNMMGISVTAVQTVVNLDKPEEAIRTGIFLGAEQFHLFVISLPGQVLIDHCSQLAEDIYSATWYQLPVRIQKMLYTMQIRGSKRLALTAGGLYEMNIENFGIVAGDPNVTTECRKINWLQRNMETIREGLALTKMFFLEDLATEWGCQGCLPTFKTCMSYFTMLMSLKE